MAAVASSRALISALRPLPILTTLATRTASSSTTLFWQRTNFAISLLRVAALPAFTFKLPNILTGLWDSILRAVPKKKTSHMKKRHRFLAGKALKDVTHLNKCPACGTTKRAHLLCPYCVREIKDMWQGRDVTGKKTGAKIDGALE